MENNTTTQSIYGEHKPALENTMNDILAHIKEIRAQMNAQLGMDPFEHCLGRIRSEMQAQQLSRDNSVRARRYL